MKYIWNILKDVPECSLNLGTYGILILNTPLVNHDPSLLSTLWNNGKLHSCFHLSEVMLISYFTFQPIVLYIYIMYNT